MPTTMTSPGTSSPSPSSNATGADRCDADAAADLDAVVGVHCRARSSHLGTEPADQRRRGPFEHDDGVAAAARAVAATSSPMKPAPITTTRALPSRRRARRSSASSSVRNSTTWGQSAWPGKPPRRGAGRDDDRRRTRSRSRRRRSAGAPSTSRLGGRCAESPRHTERVEVVGLAELDPVGLPFAGQQLLRQRRPVVRSMRLRADD